MGPRVTDVISADHQRRCRRKCVDPKLSTAINAAITNATEMETTIVAVPAVLAVRVEVRVPAARTAAPYTSLPRLCVRLQEKPSKAKYVDQVCNALQGRLQGRLVGELSQTSIAKMVKQEKQKCHRKEYQRVNKQHHRQKKRIEKAAELLAQYGLSTTPPPPPPAPAPAPEAQSLGGVAEYGLAEYGLAEYGLGSLGTLGAAGGSEILS